MSVVALVIAPLLAPEETVTTGKVDTKANVEVVSEATVDTESEAK